MRIFIYFALLAECLVSVDADAGAAAAAFLFTSGVPYSWKFELNAFRDFSKFDLARSWSDQLGSSFGHCLSSGNSREGRHRRVFHAHSYTRGVGFRRSGKRCLKMRTPPRTFSRCARSPIDRRYDCRLVFVGRLPQRSQSGKYSIPTGFVYNNCIMRQQPFNLLLSSFTKLRNAVNRSYYGTKSKRLPAQCPLRNEHSST